MPLSTKESEAAFKAVNALNAHHSCEHEMVIQHYGWCGEALPIELFTDRRDKRRWACSCGRDGIYPNFTKCVCGRLAPSNTVVSSFALPYRLQHNNALSRGAPWAGQPVGAGERFVSLQQGDGRRKTYAEAVVYGPDRATDLKGKGKRRLLWRQRRKERREERLQGQR